MYRGTQLTQTTYRSLEDLIENYNIWSMATLKKRKKRRKLLNLNAQATFLMKCHMYFMNFMILQSSSQTWKEIFFYKTACPRPPFWYSCALKIWSGSPRAVRKCQIYDRLLLFSPAISQLKVSEKTPTLTFCIPLKNQTTGIFISCKTKKCWGQILQWRVGGPSLKIKLNVSLRLQSWPYTKIKKNGVCLHRIIWINKNVSCQLACL